MVVTCNGVAKGNPASVYLEASRLLSRKAFLSSVINTSTEGHRSIWNLKVPWAQVREGLVDWFHSLRGASGENYS